MQNVTSNNFNDNASIITNSTDIHNYSYNNRTDHYRLDSLPDSSSDKQKPVTDSITNDEININIFRFKFTEEFTDSLYRFSKIHQYDHRKDFKEAWNTWIEENDEIVDKETRRLIHLGYEGDTMDKMFKSARYYFRKKSAQKKDPIKRRVYYGAQKELLEAMDNHIKMHILENNFKPSEGFDSFCKEHIDVIKEEVNQLCKNGFTNAVDVKNKIKKTYKNRYFLFITK